MSLQGKIKKINETQTFGNNFQKRELILTTQEKYPQPLSIEFVQDKCAILDNYNVGDDVEIGINLRGREWTNPKGEVKYFNSIQGWKISKSGDNQLQKAASTIDNAMPASDEDDDLPF